MRQFYLSKLVIFIAVLSGWNLSASAQTTVFNYTGGVQSWVCPPGVTSVGVDAIGANGGNGYITYGAGGKGGRVQCTMTTVPGTTYYIYVGGMGGNPAGGYNGGGKAQY